MHFEVLNAQQQKILPRLGVFKKQYYLVGGTAIALQIGHRFSIDFDLFSLKPINHSRLTGKLIQQDIQYILLFKNAEGLHLLSEGVKITFFEYPFSIPHRIEVDGHLTMPALLDLAAMKAYALGRRSKWKDYVDLYFLLRDHFSFHEISAAAEKLFGGAFSKKLFKTQLGYFDDVDYSEQVDYLPGFHVADENIKAFLSDLSFESF
jgi:hypothetical protein